MARRYTLIALTRARKRWTQAELAQAAGVSVGTIARVEARAHMPHLRNLASIAEALDIDLERVLEDLEEEVAS
jgi:transcriptional regulator with XRE-family HTH domain